MWREIVFGLLLFFTLALAAAAQGWIGWGSAVFFGALLAIAVYDVLQRQHTILRNFPLLGHIRYLLESIRPEIQQYFIESDTNGAPISRIFRGAVYKKAKDELETVPFGSELNFYSDSYKWVNHSCFPTSRSNADYRVTIGQGEKAYCASLLNISAMSYGSLGSRAISALGSGARMGGFSHNTGEGGLSPYHLGTGADLVWQLGTAYFGARDRNGYFDPVAFAEQAQYSQVKMIEIKLSQGAKPGHGGVLPGPKVTEEIAKIRRVPVGKAVISPPGHTAFTTPAELCQFVEELRRLSGGKPVGFKLCLGRRDEFIKICEAIRETGLAPDFITVDGGEGGTGAAPFDFINYVGSPLNEALFFVHITLKEFGLRDRIKIIASGKIFTGYDMFEKLALGADLCNSARGMMLALGCIQAYRCNTGSCPTGIATNRPDLQRGLDVTDKSVRVFNYHQKTLFAFSELLAAAGLHTPGEIALKHISCRYQGRILTLAEVHERTAELSRHERRDRKQKPHTEPQPHVSVVDQ